MKQAFQKLLENVADLFKVKSLITLSLTGLMIAMLVGAFNPPQEFVTLFCTSYGAIITYFFNKKDEAPKTTNSVPVVDKEPTDANYE